MRPVEEGDLGPGTAQLVPVEQVVGRDIVLVDRLLDQPQPQDPRVERDVLRRLRGYRRKVMQTAKLHKYYLRVDKKKFRTKLKLCQGRAGVRRAGLRPHREGADPALRAAPKVRPGLGPRRQLSCREPRKGR